MPTRCQVWRFTWVLPFLWRIFIYVRVRLVLFFFFSGFRFAQYTRNAWTHGRISITRALPMLYCAKVYPVFVILQSTIYKSFSSIPSFFHSRSLPVFICFSASRVLHPSVYHRWRRTIETGINYLPFVQSAGSLPNDWTDASERRRATGLIQIRTISIIPFDRSSTFHGLFFPSTVAKFRSATDTCMRPIRRSSGKTWLQPPRTISTIENSFFLDALIIICDSPAESNKTAFVRRQVVF